jgi:hypothetical protein
LWPPIRRAYAWVHQAARILENAAGEPAEMVRRRLDGLLAAMARHRAMAGPLAEAVEHFRKVSRSYRPGLFHCYAVADLPRTNNALEQLFGSYRRHERRATGRKANSSVTVLRGPVRLLAGLATRLRRQDASDLAGADRQRWREARQSRAPSPCPRAARAVPPRSRRLSQPARTAPVPASFAVLEKKPPRTHARGQHSDGAQGGTRPPVALEPR